MENYKTCPNCNYKCDDDSNFCENCGYKFNEAKTVASDVETEVKTENKSVIAHIFEFIIGLVVFIIVIVGIFSSSSEPKCDNSDVTNLAVNAFKESSLYYRSLSPNQVSQVVLENTSEVSHDESIKKYFCKGTIVIKSAQGGNDYKCDIEYTSQQSEDSIYVETSNCNDKYINRQVNNLINQIQYETEYSYEE